ncbi:hypothetical protein ACFZAD_24620 [Streptomyces iakyrus]|uniref:hypothetical protein n=1 Tax=Streptomyces iakyrus TaxID=68219 RepID=UPI0036E723B3
MANRINIVVSTKADPKPLEQYSDQLDKTGGQASRLGTNLGALAAVLGRTTLAVGAAGGAATAAGIALGVKFNSSVEQSEAKLMAFMKDSQKVAKTLAWVKEEAAATQFSFTDMADAAANLTPVAKSSGKSLQSLIKQAEILAALNPTEGLTGATFALREALSGDWVSIVERFNLPRLRINELKEQGVPAMEIISKTLKEMGIDYSLVAKQGQTTAARFDQIKDKLTMMAGAATKPIFDRISKELDTLGQFDFQGLGEDMADVAVGSLKAFDQLTKEVIGLGKEVGSFLAPATDDLGDAIGNTLLPAIEDVVESEFAQYLGGALVGAAYGAIRVLEFLVRTVGGFTSQVSGATPVLLGLTAGIAGYQAVIGAATAKTAAFAAAQNVLNNAMKLNPFALVVAGAVGITAAYISAISQTDRNSSATQRLKTAQDALTQATRAAKDAQDALRGAQLSQEGASLRVEQAKRRLNEVTRQYGAKSLEARQAAHDLRVAQDELARSTRAVKDRTNEATAAQKERVKAEAAVKGASSRIGGQVGSEARQWNNLASAIDNAKKAQGTTRSGKAQSDILMKSVKPTQPGRIGFASGTNYAPGGMTLVGERGPEMVNLPRGSQVTQAYRTRSTSSQTAPSTVTINIYGSITNSTPEASNAFWDRVDKAQRLAKVGMA